MYDYKKKLVTFPFNGSFHTIPIQDFEPETLQINCLQVRPIYRAKINGIVHRVDIDTEYIIGPLDGNGHWIQQ